MSLICSSSLVLKTKTKKSNNYNNTVQTLVRRDYPKRIHAHTCTRSPAHTSIITDYTQLNSVTTNLRKISNRDWRRRKIEAQKGKDGRSIVLAEKEMS